MGNMPSKDGMPTHQSALRESGGGSSTTCSFCSSSAPPGDSLESPPVCSRSYEEERERCVALLLPHEVIMRIFSQLDYRDLIHCSLACRQWHAESKDLREGWKEEYLEACCVRGLIQWDNDPPRARYDAYLACSPD